MRFGKVGSFMGPVLLAAGFLYGCSYPESPAPVSSGGETPTVSLTPTMRLVPSTATAAPGATVTFTVEGKDLGEVYYAAVDLTYDPAGMEFLEAAEGGFLSRDGADATLFRAALQDAQAGKIAVGLTRLGDIGGVTGAGTLLTLSFKALNSGTTSLGFSNPKALRDPQNQDIAVEAWESATVDISSP